MFDKTTKRTHITIHQPSHVRNVKTTLRQKNGLKTSYHGSKVE